MSRAAMEQALEALELCRLNGSQYLYGNERDIVFSAIAALRAELAGRVFTISLKNVPRVDANTKASLEAAARIPRRRNYPQTGDPS